MMPIVNFCLCVQLDSVSFFFFSFFVHTILFLCISYGSIFIGIACECHFGHKSVELYGIGEFFLYFIHSLFFFLVLLSRRTVRLFVFLFISLSLSQSWYRSVRAIIFVLCTLMRVRVAFVCVPIFFRCLLRPRFGLH